MNIKTVLKSSVAAAALLAIAAPAANADIKNSNKNSLTVGGYVTKALMWADDGTSDQLFITDGQTEQSRVRWLASGKLNENVSAGAAIEMEIPLSNANTSAALNQKTGESTTDTAAWGIRHQYVWVSHKKFGKIKLGNTDAAGNGTAQANLSGLTGVMSNESFGQGITFVDPITGGVSSSGVTVGTTLNDFDMTSRTDVIRYDAPKFAGLGLSASLNGGGGTEFGAVYSGKFGGVAVLAKAGYSNVSGTSTTVDDITAGSLAVLHDSGLNASVSYGTQDFKANTPGRDDPTNLYLSLGYKAKIFGTGGTNFAVKWANTDDLLNQGDEATAISLNAQQNFDAIGAFVNLSWVRYEYETLTNKDLDLDDIDVITLQTLFNF